MPLNLLSISLGSNDNKTRMTQRKHGHQVAQGTVTRTLLRSSPKEFHQQLLQRKETEEMTALTGQLGGEPYSSPHNFQGYRLWQQLTPFTLFLRSKNSHQGNTHHGVLEQVLEAGQTGAVVAGIFSFDGVLEVSQEWLQVSGITEELWKHRERLDCNQCLSLVKGSQRRNFLCQAEPSWLYSLGPVTAHYKRSRVQTRGLKKAQCKILVIISSNTH